MKKTSWKYLVDVLMFLSMIGIILIGLLLAFILKEGPAVKESDKFFIGLHRHQWTHIHLYLSIAFSVLLIFHLLLEWGWIKGKTKQLFKGSWKPALWTIVTASVLLPFVFWVFLPKNAPEYYEFGFGRGTGGRGGQASLAGQDRRLPLPSEPPARSSEPLPEPRHREDATDTQEGRKDVRPVRSADVEESHVGGEKTKPGKQELEAKLVSGYQEGDTAAFVITGRMTLRQVEAETGVSARSLLTKMGLPNNISRDEALGRIRRRHGFTLVDFRTAVEALMEKK